MSHVAFLRAINTGGRRVSNDQLVEITRSLGFDDATAYQASGNLILGSAVPGGAAGSELEAHLSVGLERALGYDVPVMIRSLDELRAITEARPFGDDEPLPGSKPQIAILASSSVDASTVASFATSADRLALVGREIHWWPTEGVSTSALDVRALEAAVGTLTVRTQATIERLVARIS